MTRPPISVAAYATAYRCTDCDSEPGAITQDALGIWHVEIKHDERCPVLTGHVSPNEASLAAAQAAVNATGRPVAYWRPS